MNIDDLFENSDNEKDDLKDSTDSTDATNTKGNEKSSNGERENKPMADNVDSHDAPVDNDSDTINTEENKSDSKSGETSFLKQFLVYVLIIWI